MFNKQHYQQPNPPSQNKQEYNVQKTCYKCGCIHKGDNCSTNVTQFIWKHGGKRVLISGTWNKWQASIQLNPLAERKEWYQITLSLPVGKYEYKYIVDNQWVYDSNEAKVSDGYKGYNNVVEVFPKYFTVDETTETEFSDQDDVMSKSPPKQRKVKQQTEQQKNYQKNVTITTGLDAESICVTGNWDNWVKKTPMTRRFNNLLNRYENETVIKLYPGQYQYKFILNGIYVSDNQLKMIKNDMGSFNNLIYVPKTVVSKKDESKQIQFNPYKLKWKQQNIYCTGLESLIGHSMNDIGDSIYIYGGQKGFGEYINTMFELSLENFDADPMEFMNQAPLGRAFHVSYTYGDKILIFGGIGDGVSMQSDCQVFNITHKTWETYELKGTRPSKREKSANTLYPKNQCILVFGGYHCTEDLEAEYHFNDIFSLNLANLIWTQIHVEGKIPEKRLSAQLETFKNNLFLFGGVQYLNASPNKYFNDMWTLDLESKSAILSWKNITDEILGTPPPKRYGFTMTKMKNYFIVFGGKGENQVHLNDTWIFDAKRYSWIQPDIQGTSPSARFYHGAIRINDFGLVIMGGQQKQRKKLGKIHILTSSDEEEQQKEEQTKQKPKLQKICKTESELLEQRYFKNKQL